MSTITTNANVTRRDLVKGAALGAAAIGAASVMTGSAHAKDASAKADAAGDFDEQYDVVVLGMGGAGMNAAIAAYEEGAKVLLCEKAPEGQEPCNTKVAGQVILSTDDADAFYTYLTHLMGKFRNYDDDCLRAYADGAAENFDWMVNTLGGDPDLIYPDHKIPTWDTPFHYDEHDSFWGIDRKGMVMVWDEFPEYEGHEHSIVLSFSGSEHDSSYYLQMRDQIAKREGENLTVYLGTPGKRLICDEAGAVVGAVVEKDGKELRVGATGGVVLATGGYESNQTMLANYTQIPYLYPRAAAMNTGDGVEMAQRVGAQLWHMSNISGLGFGYHRDGTAGSMSVTGTKNGIYVGPAGGRFMNEQARGRHGRVSFGGAWKMTPVTNPCYLIVDADHIADPLVKGFSDGNADEIASGEILSADTLEELGKAIRATGKADQFDLNGELEETVERYNAHCEAGEVDDFGRTCTEAVKTAPFYALELSPTMLNTQGGPRHNGEAQVLDMDALPIDGLFSAGELGSIFPDMYNGGGNLGETMVFGRIAGRNAAHRAQGTFKGATEPSVLVQEEDDAAAASEAKASDADKAALVGGTFADGTYEGTGKGYSSDIVLSIKIENGKIASCEVKSSAETATVGETALPTYCEDIVTTQDPAAIDVAAGASTTLKGFSAAVYDVLEQAKK